MTRRATAEPMLPIDFRQPRKAGKREPDDLYSAILYLRWRGVAVYRCGSRHKVDGKIAERPAAARPRRKPRVDAVSDATPMPCLADTCPTPLACNDRGQCKAREADRWACWWQAFDECRRRGIADPFRKREAQ